jgi:predicted transcriptional regulator
VNTLVSIEDYLTDQKKDPNFSEEYSNLEEEFTLAAEIVALRTEMNMTQKELANIVGTSQPAIARLESGRYSNVSMRFIRKVAQALHAVPELHFRKAK